ncbi:hypothetical protein ACS0TY_029330 [Phlomoides rotata]
MQKHGKKLRSSAMKTSQSYSIKVWLQFHVAQITRLSEAYEDAKCVGVGALTYLAVVRGYLVVEVDNAIKRGNFQDWVQNCPNIALHVIHRLLPGIASYPLNVLGNDFDLYDKSNTFVPQFLSVYN